MIPAKNVKNGNAVLSIIIILALLVGIAWYAYKQELEKIVESNPNDMANWPSYQNESYGLSFKYPPHYFLEEKEVGNGERKHYAIILTEDTEENRLVREGKSPGREGPIAITFDVYQNNLDKLSLIDWLTKTNASNFKLSDGTYATTTIASINGINYRWSGLYEADAVAFLHKENIIAATATYIAPEDSTLKDFEKILETIHLD